MALILWKSASHLSQSLPQWGYLVFSHDGGKAFSATILRKDACRDAGQWCICNQGRDEMGLTVDNTASPAAATRRPNYKTERLLVQPPVKEQLELTKPGINTGCEDRGTIRDFGDTNTESWGQFP